MHGWLQLLRPTCEQWTLHAFYTSPSNYSLKCRKTIINGKPSSALTSQEYNCFVKHTVVRPTPAPPLSPCTQSVTLKITIRQARVLDEQRVRWTSLPSVPPIFRTHSWTEQYNSWLCIWVWCDHCIMTTSKMWHQTIFSLSLGEGNLGSIFCIKVQGITKQYSMFGNERRS